MWVTCPTRGAKSESDLADQLNKRLFMEMINVLKVANHFIFLC